MLTDATPIEEMFSILRFTDIKNFKLGFARIGWNTLKLVHVLVDEGALDPVVEVSHVKDPTLASLLPPSLRQVVVVLGNHITNTVS